MLKIGYYFVLGLFLTSLWACEEDEVFTNPINPEPIKKDSEIPFRFLVRGDDKLDIRLEEGFIQSAKVFLTSGTDTTQLASFKPQLSNQFFLIANIDYTFPANEVDLLLELRKEYNDTIYQVPILDYQHQYVTDLQSEQLIAFDNYLYEYEISPDGSSFFYSIHPSDGFSNAKLYRYNLLTNENTLLEENFKGSTIRALSNTEYYYVTKYDGERILSLDSAMLMRKNLETNEEKSVAVVSFDYGRFSRIIDDRMLVVRPYLAEPNCYHINTSNDGLREVTYNYPMMLESRRDHIWLGNFRVLQNTGIQSFEVAQDNNFSIIAYDEDKNQIQGILYDYALSDDPPYFNKIQVYENDNLLFQEKAWQRKYVSLITGNNHGEKPMIVYQKIFNSSNGTKDGFYLYNQNEPNGRLIYSEPDEQNINFWVDDQTFITVRLEGLYKYSVPADL